MFARLRPSQALSPVIGLLKGLTDPVVGLLMGQTAENLAWRFGISRQQMDEYSVRSHQRAVAARTAGRLGEIVPLVDGKGKVYSEDDGVRADSSMAGLARLKPFFDRKYGRVTPGNSSQITDGAAWLLLASAAAVDRVAARAARQPLPTASGPASIRRRWASARCMPQRRSCSAISFGLADIDLWEINEAFAAQVLGCLAAWESDDYCREQLGSAGRALA
jgi:acetyl-CoA C-acetyltransferase